LSERDATDLEDSRDCDRFGRPLRAGRGRVCLRLVDTAVGLRPEPRPRRQCRGVARSYNKLSQEMKEKYGDRAKVSFEYPPGRTSVERDGEIIYDQTQTPRLNDVIGVFMVGKRKGATDMPFPFRLAPDQDLNRVDRALATALRNRFGKDLPQRWLSFSDQDWTIDRCTTLPAGLGLGGAGLLMRLGKGTACVVTWRRAQPAPVSMLISVSVAKGDPWMRPFSRRLCRAITETALADVDRGERDRRPTLPVSSQTGRPVRARRRRCRPTPIRSGRNCALRSWNKPAAFATPRLRVTPNPAPC